MLRQLMLALKIFGEIFHFRLKSAPALNSGGPLSSPSAYRIGVFFSKSWMVQVLQIEVVLHLVYF